MRSRWLYYDYTLTIAEEVRCIWGRKFSGGTVIFLVIRYASLLEQVVLVVEQGLHSGSGIVGTGDVGNVSVNISVAL